jgi:phage portal protein BeeE
MAIYRPNGAKNVDAAKAMANFTGWTFAAVNAIASEVANIQLRLYRVDGDDHTEVDDHDLLTLLDAPNDHMTGVELKYVLMSHLELAGNFYAYLEGVKSDTDQPRALHPLNPGSIRVKLTKEFPQKLDHYEFTLNGQICQFKPYEVLHIKYVDPSDRSSALASPRPFRHGSTATTTRWSTTASSSSMATK